jgi:putative membrane protein
MVVKFLATAAVTGLLLNAAVGPTRVVAQTAAQAAALAADSNFIQLAGSLGLLQVKLGKLAEEKGSSPAVREFGKKMIADYSKVNEELAAGAKQAAYPAPIMLRQHQQILERFVRTGRSSFDKKYMAEMVSEHGEAARLFRQEAESGRVASLKQVASQMLPTVQQHLTLATETAGTVGADVTATTEGARQGS